MHDTAIANHRASVELWLEILLPQFGLLDLCVDLAMWRRRGRRMDISRQPRRSTTMGACPKLHRGGAIAQHFVFLDESHDVSGLFAGALAN